MFKLSCRPFRYVFQQPYPPTRAERKIEVSTNLSYYSKKWAALRRLKIAFWAIYLVSVPSLMAIQSATDS